MVKSEWRKVRVVVEVPVLGEFSEKDLAWEVKAFTEHNASFLRRWRGIFNRDGVAFGRVVVKEFNRVTR